MGIVANKISFPIVNLPLIKRKYTWKATYIQFGSPTNVDDIISKSNANISLAFMYSAFSGLSKERFVEFLKLCFKEESYPEMFALVNKYELSHIYIGGVKYTESLYWRSNQNSIFKRW